MTNTTCPTCGKSFAPATSPASPFCCDRCRQIDLGRWLGENYAFPSSRFREDEEEPGPEEESE